MPATTHDTRIKGRIAGATVMFGFGALWFSSAGYTEALPLWLRAALWISGCALAIWILALGARAPRLPAPAPSPEQKASSRRMWRKFGVVSGLEGGAIFAAVIILSALHRPAFIASAIAIVVGLHFFPLAKLFGAAIYYKTAVVGTTIGIAALGIGDFRWRGEFLGISFGALLWITAAAVLIGAGKTLRAVVTPPRASRSTPASR